jgi:hypothetical protein
MALLAKLTDVQSHSDRRQTVRRQLQLVALITYAEAANGVVILDLSSTGLMFETAIPLQVGDHIEVDLPRAKSQDARVIWQRENYFGCRFATPVPQAVISAALLRSPAPNAPSQQAESAPTPDAAPALTHGSLSPPAPSPRHPTSPLLTSLSLWVLGGAVGLLLLGLLII